MDLDSGVCVNIRVSSRIISEVGVKVELALVGFVLVGLRLLHRRPKENLAEEKGCLAHGFTGCSSELTVPLVLRPLGRREHDRGS